jgi:hypothetical protein
MPKAQLQTCRVEFDPTVQGKNKRIPRATVRVYNSRGVKFGATFSDLEEAPPRFLEPLGQPPSLVTEDLELPLPTDWDVNGQLCLEQDYPLPAHILGVIPMVEPGG